MRLPKKDLRAVIFAITLMASILTVWHLLPEMFAQSYLLGVIILSLVIIVAYKTNSN